MKKLVAFLSLLLASLFAQHSSACLEPRPSGQAGSNMPVTYVTGITGYNDQLRVTWKTTNSNNVNVSLISMGADTGLTMTGGLNNTTYANRVVKLSTHSVGGTPYQHYWMINDTYRLDFWGMGPGAAWFYNVGAMNFRGAGGALFGIAGAGGGEAIPGSGSISGHVVFVGGDNGSIVTHDRWIAFPPATGCTDPVAVSGYSRGVMLARSFFPQPERAARQWWEV